MEKEKPLKYADFEKKLIPILNKKLKAIGATDKDGFTIAGATNSFLQDEIGENANINLGGTNIPQVMVVGNSTFAVYYFALKPLLAELDKDTKESDKDGG